MSLRLRLTLWYCTLLALLLALIAIISLALVRASVLADVNNEIQRKGDQIANLLEMGAPSTPMTNILGPAISASFAPELYVLVRNLDRRVSYRSTNLANRLIPLPDAQYEQAVQGQNGFYSLSFQRPNDLRVYFRPVHFGGDIIGIVQIGRNLTTEQAILRRLATSLFWICTAALALAAGVGYWLAGVALRPIQEATATALEITRTGRLDRRVAVARARQDEVGALINTFNEMLARLQELFDRQRRFSGDISHELRTPLTTILGNTTLLKRGAALPAEERAEMLDEIEFEAQHMRRLTTDLLLLAQADAGLAIQHERVELNALLQDVYRQAKRRAGDRDFRIVHEEPAVVLGDADRLRQALINLVDNAIQYTPPTGRIELSLRTLGSQAEITVSDTGQGISVDDLPHIFDRFYRADKARTRAAGGAGLGLAIVQWVVEAHWGEIAVESKPGEGSTFRIRLPLAERIAVAALPAAPV